MEYPDVKYSIRRTNLTSEDFEIFSEDPQDVEKYLNEPKN